MAYVVTALWHAKPDKADRVFAAMRFKPNRHADAPVRFRHADSEHPKRRVLGGALPGLLEDRERLFRRSVGEA